MQSPDECFLFLNKYTKRVGEAKHLHLFIYFNKHINLLVILNIRSIAEKQKLELTD
jgi:hypothetical protein